MAHVGKYLILLLVALLTLFAAPLVVAQADQKSLSVAQAEFVQGSRYFYGLENKKDMDKALSWYMRSAKKGHAKSELAVSQVLAYGEPKNPRFAAALPWLIKASEPHTTPQISGMKVAEAGAKKNLLWMCNKGLVDFPEDHPYAQDSKCWLKRGNRLFYGSSPLDYYLLKDKGAYYGVTKDYVSARHYLEKAFEAGKTSAAGNLAKIYHDGLGVPKDMEKFNYYVNAASNEGHAQSSYYLAERALGAKDFNKYIAKLGSAAEDGHRKSLSKLAWVYFNGDNVDTDNKTAFMYFFLAGHSQYVRNRRVRGGDTRLPFFKNRFLPTFKTEASLEFLGEAHDKALNFAKENKFRSSQIEDINRSYNIAVSDFHYVEKTGGEWHKSDISTWILFYFGFFILLMVIRSVAGAIAHKP